MIPTNRDVQEFMFGTGAAVTGWGCGSLAPLPDFLAWVAMPLGIVVTVIGTIGFIRSLQP